MGAENSKVNRLSLRKENLSEIERIRFETDKARKHAMMLKKIRDQLLIDFRIAEDKCWYDDSGAVQCDTSALVGAEAVLKMLAKIKNQIDIFISLNGNISIMYLICLTNHVLIIGLYGKFRVVLISYFSL